MFSSIIALNLKNTQFDFTLLFYLINFSRNTYFMMRICCIFSAVPFFSILIPAFNNVELLARAISSVLKQDFTDYEILVSDDCSPINLQVELQNLFSSRDVEAIRFFRQKKNLGVLGNQKFLLNNANGIWCVFLQHDDFFLEGSLLGELQSMISLNSSLVLSFGNSLCEDFEGAEAQPMFQGADLDGIGKPLNSGDEWFIASGASLFRLFAPPANQSRLSLNWSSVFFKKEAIDAVDGFTSKYLVPSELEDSLDVFTSEENMVAFTMILEKGQVLYTEKSVAFRGRPADAFSSSLSHPGRNRKNDIEFFNFIRASRLVSSDLLKRLMERRAYSIGLGKPTVKIWIFLGANFYASKVISLMVYTKLKLKLVRVYSRLLNSSYWNYGLKAIFLRLVFKKIYKT